MEAPRVDIDHVATVGKGRGRRRRNHNMSDKHSLPQYEGAQGRDETQSKCKNRSKSPSGNNTVKILINLGIESRAKGTESENTVQTRESEYDLQICGGGQQTQVGHLRHFNSFQVSGLHLHNTQFIRYLLQLLSVHIVLTPGFITYTPTDISTPFSS